MFKVIVPRYNIYKSNAITNLYRLPRPEVGDGIRRTRKGVLELKGELILKYNTRAVKFSCNDRFRDQSVYTGELGPVYFEFSVRKKSMYHLKK